MIVDEEGHARGHKTVCWWFPRIPQCCVRCGQNPWKLRTWLVYTPERGGWGNYLPICSACLLDLKKPFDVAKHTLSDLVTLNLQDQTTLEPWMFKLRCNVQASSPRFDFTTNRVKFETLAKGSGRGGYKPNLKQLGDRMRNDHGGRLKHNHA